MNYYFIQIEKLRIFGEEYEDMEASLKAYVTKLIPFINTISTIDIIVDGAINEDANKKIVAKIQFRSCFNGNEIITSGTLLFSRKHDNLLDEVEIETQHLGEVKDKHRISLHSCKDIISGKPFILNRVSVEYNPEPSNEANRIERNATSIFVLPIGYNGLSYGRYLELTPVDLYNALTEINVRKYEQTQPFKIDDPYIDSLNKHMIGYLEVHRDDLTTIKPLLTALLLNIMDQYQEHLKLFKSDMEDMGTAYADEAAKAADLELTNMARVKEIFKDNMKKNVTMNKAEYLAYVYGYRFGPMILDNIFYETLVALIKEEFTGDEWEKLELEARTLPEHSYNFYLNSGRFNTRRIEIDIHPLVKIIKTSMRPIGNSRSERLTKKISVLKAFQLVIENEPDDYSKSLNRMYKDQIGDLIDRLEWLMENEPTAIDKPNKTKSIGRMQE